jgi:DNA-binding IclR family transcriptional regulator
MAKPLGKDTGKRGQLDKNYIQVMEKIFAVLEHFIKEGARQEALSFQAVAASVPFAKTTVHRILYSLQKLSYLERDSTQARHFSQHLAAVRERGVAFDLAENVEGVTCVAAPIFDQRGRVVAGISVSGPATRMEAKLGRLEEEVREAGLKISRMLGFGLGRGQDQATSLESVMRGRDEAALLLSGD